MKNFSIGVLALSVLSTSALAQDAQEAKVLDQFKNPMAWSRVVVVTKRGKDEFNPATGVFTKNKSYVETSRKTVTKAEFVRTGSEVRSRSVVLTLSDGSKLGVFFDGMQELDIGHDWHRDPVFAARFKSNIASGIQTKKGLKKSSANEIELSIALDADRNLSNLVKRTYQHAGESWSRDFEFPKGTMAIAAQNLGLAFKNFKTGERLEMDLSEWIQEGIKADEDRQRAIEELEYEEERMQLEKQRQAEDAQAAKEEAERASKAVESQDAGVVGSEGQSVE